MRSRFFFGMALFFSLALNVFLLGQMAQRPASPHWHGHPQPIDRMMENAERLSEPTRGEVKKIIASYRPAFEAQVTRMRASRKDLDALLKSEDYTREKADAQFEAMQAEMGKMQDIAKNMILDVNEKLTPADRVKMMPTPPHDEKLDGDHAADSDAPKVIPMSHHPKVVQP